MWILIGHMIYNMCVAESLAGLAPFTRTPGNSFEVLLHIDVQNFYDKYPRCSSAYLTKPFFDVDCEFDIALF